MLFGAGGEILSCAYFWMCLLHHSQVVWVGLNMCVRVRVLWGGVACYPLWPTTDLLSYFSTLKTLWRQRGDTRSWSSPRKVTIINNSADTINTNNTNLLCVIYKGYNKMDHSKMNQQAFSRSFLWRIASRDSLKHDQLFVPLWGAIITGSLWAQNRIINIHLYIITFAS